MMRGPECLDRKDRSGIELKRQVQSICASLYAEAEDALNNRGESEVRCALTPNFEIQGHTLAEAQALVWGHVVEEVERAGYTVKRFEKPRHRNEMAFITFLWQNSANKKEVGRYEKLLDKYEK